MKLSIVIPAYNEALNLPTTITEFYNSLIFNKIEHEILIVNDNSKDNTVEVVTDLQKKISTLRLITNSPPNNGFGYAIRLGLDNFVGDCVAIVMADLSDSPDDLVRFYNKFVEDKVDCVFGNRFSKESVLSGYPKKKLYIKISILNININI